MSWSWEKAAAKLRQDQYSRDLQDLRAEICILSLEFEFRDDYEIFFQKRCAYKAKQPWKNLCLGILCAQMCRAVLRASKGHHPYGKKAADIKDWTAIEIAEAFSATNRLTKHLRVAVRAEAHGTPLQTGEPSLQRIVDDFCKNVEEEAKFNGRRDLSR